MLVHAKTLEEVQQAIASHPLVVVDVYASWCPPCKALAPILESVQDQCHIVKINSDESLETAVEFNITGLPTLLFFKGGQEVEKVVGLVNKEALEAKIARHKA